MKLLLFAVTLSLAAFLTSCSKKDGVEDKGQTFITITNNFGSPLQNLAIGVLKGSSETELVNTIQMLDQNAVSGKIEVKHKDTDKVFLFFDHFDGNTYMVMQPFPIVQGSTASLIITDFVNYVPIQKNTGMYPK